MFWYQPEICFSVKPEPLGPAHHILWGCFFLFFSPDLVASVLAGQKDLLLLMVSVLGQTPLISCCGEMAPLHLICTLCLLHAGCDQPWASSPGKKERNAFGGA
jgi:hypothetical protein